MDGLTLNGVAEGNFDNTPDDPLPVLRLVPDEEFQSGSVFSSTTVNAAEFTTEFQFRITDPGGIPDTTGEVGADGFVFVIQSIDDEIGGTGGGMGYGGIPTSVGIEFDTWKNSADPDSNHIGILINGNTNSIGNSVPIDKRFDDGTLQKAWIDYDGTTLKVYIRTDGGDVKPSEPVIKKDLDIPAIIGQSDAFVGFTAGTGGDFGNHYIVNWIYSDSFIRIYSIDDKSLPEGDFGTTPFEFTVTRSGDTSGVSTVIFATSDGTASFDSNYSSSSDSLTFTAGQTERTATVLVNGDTDVESDETFTVNLTCAGSDACDIIGDPGLGTILNDDFDECEECETIYSIEGVSEFEGDSGFTVFEFTVTRSGDTSGVSTVNFATSDGTATLSDSDYEENSGPLTFDEGDTERIVTVLVTGDTKVELDETFNVNLTCDGCGFIDALGVGTILNDDANNGAGGQHEPPSFGESPGRDYWYYHDDVYNSSF